MTVDLPQVQVRLHSAREMAVEAGRLTLQYFHRQLEVERKEDGSPVTLADRQAEEHLRQRILSQFPQDGIVGEEFGQVIGESGFRWILDPIDGTKSFISGVPIYGTMIGLEYGTNCVAGVIYFPALDELLYAGSGGGCWHGRPGDDPQPARASLASDLSEGVFLTSELGNFDLRQAGKVFRQLHQRCWITRTWGDCYGYYLVATGRALVMVDPLMCVWDAAALLPILQEAGGCFCDWAGRPTIHSGEGIGCGPKVLEQVLELTRPFVKK